MVAAPAAEPVCLIPAKKVMGSNPCKSRMAGIGCPEDADILIGIATKGDRGEWFLKIGGEGEGGCQEILKIVNGKQIMVSTWVLP